MYLRTLNQPIARRILVNSPDFQERKILYASRGMEKRQVAYMRNKRRILSGFLTLMLDARRK